MPEGCLIIGLGQIGMAYDLSLEPVKAVYSHARALSLHPAFELRGAVDPSEKQRKLFEKHYCQTAYSDLEFALKEQTPDVVVISSPTREHFSVLNMVLSYSKPKVILCEKPLAYDLVEAQKMVEACDNAGVKLFVNYMRRADPGAIEVKNRIESNAIVTPIKGVAWYSKGFLHNGSHFFNLLEFWLGDCVTAEVLDAGRLWDNNDPEPDVYVEFEHGKVVFQAAWEESYSHYTLELVSPAGRLRYEQGGEYITWQSTCPDPNYLGYTILNPHIEIIANGMNHYQRHVTDQLDAALSGKPHNLCSGWQALSTLEAMQKIIIKR